LKNKKWWRKDEATGKYRGLEAGMSRIAFTIREAGGVDGVMGFSQGGCMAALVASALEQPHHNPPDSDGPDSNSGTDYAWLRDLREANNNRPLSFCVVYSGFYAPPTAGLEWLYEPVVGWLRERCTKEAEKEEES
jgi:hypothetical protein